MADPVRDSLGLRACAAARRVERHLGRVFSRFSIPAAHGQVLLALYETPGLRIVEIAARTGFDASTASRLVKELSRRKLVRSEAHPHDARSKLLFPARRAETLRAELVRLVERLDAELGRTLTEADRAGFRNTAEVMDHLP